MAEQNFHQAVRIADRGYIIVHGEIALDARSVAELKPMISSSGCILAEPPEHGHEHGHHPTAWRLALRRY